MTAARPSTDAGRRLLAASSELFYREGITAVGVAGIAEAANVTKKTLYDCFGSKANLVAAYLTHRHETWWAELQRLVAETRPPRVLAVFDAYLDHPALELDRGCGFQRAAAELGAGHPGRAVVQRHKAAVRAEIGRLLAQDVPGAAGDLADHLYLLLEGAVFQRGLDGDSAALHQASALARDVVAAAAGQRGSVAAAPDPRRGAR